jgi:hypothetical protein
MWEVGCLHEPPCTKVKAAEGGTAEERGGDTQVNEGRGAVDKGELLDALGGEELEPASEHGAVCIDGSHELAREADEGERSRVRAEGVGNGAANGARYDARARGPALCAAAGEEMGVDEDEGPRQRVESTAVRAPSLAGRQATTRRRRSSGRPLMRSTPSPSSAAAQDRVAATETEGLGRKP